MLDAIRLVIENRTTSKNNKSTKSHFECQQNDLILSTLRYFDLCFVFCLFTFCIYKENKVIERQRDGEQLLVIIWVKFSWNVKIFVECLEKGMISSV